MSDLKSIDQNILDKINAANPGGIDLAELEYNNNMQNRAIPNKDDPAIKESFNIDRTTRNYTGAVQRGKQAERRDLLEIFSNVQLLNLINKRRDGPNISPDDVDAIKYIPNSRMGYFNKLLKIGLRDGISKCDSESVDNVWMNPESKAKLKKILNKLVVDRKNTMSVQYSTKAGVPFTCKDNKLVASFYNPGFIDNDGNNLYTTSKCQCPDEKVANKLSSTISTVHARLYDVIDDLVDEEDQQAIEEHFPKQFSDIYHWARHISRTGRINLASMQRVSRALHNLNKYQNSSYLLTLTDPFKYDLETRIPSTVPMPTAAFSVKRNINLTTNASGNLAFAISPFFLSNIALTSACAINNAATLTGTALDNNFLAVDLGQACPASFYTRYRLVSASVRLLFTSSNLNSTGFCTTSVDFDQCRTAVSPAVIAQYAKYGNYTNIENGAYKQTVAVQNGSTLQINYLPIDSSFQDFYNVENLPNGFTIAGYITGVQTAAAITVGRLDVVFNYEAFVNQTFNDYIPQGSSAINEDIDTCNMFVKQCNFSKSLHPADMKKNLPETYNQLETLHIPRDDYVISKPTDSNTIASKILNTGEKIITQIIQDEIKDKDMATKFKLADMVEIPNFDDIKERLNRMQITNTPSMIGYNTNPMLPMVSTGAGILGTMGSIGSKILPFL